MRLLVLLLGCALIVIGALVGTAILLGLDVSRNFATNHALAIIFLFCAVGAILALQVSNVSGSAIPSLAVGLLAPSILLGSIYLSSQGQNLRQDYVPAIRSDEDSIDIERYLDQTGCASPTAINPYQLVEIATTDIEKKFALTPESPVLCFEIEYDRHGVTRIRIDADAAIDFAVRKYDSDRQQYFDSIQRQGIRSVLNRISNQPGKYIFELTLPDRQAPTEGIITIGLASAFDIDAAESNVVEKLENRIGELDAVRLSSTVDQIDGGYLNLGMDTEMEIWLAVDVSNLTDSHCVHIAAFESAYDASRPTIDPFITLHENNDGMPGEMIAANDDFDINSENHFRLGALVTLRSEEFQSTSPIFARFSLGNATTNNNGLEVRTLLTSGRACDEINHSTLPF